MNFLKSIYPPEMRPKTKPWGSLTPKEKLLRILGAIFVVVFVVAFVMATIRCQQKYGDFVSLLATMSVFLLLLEVLRANESSKHFNTIKFSLVAAIFIGSIVFIFEASKPDIREQLPGPDGISFEALGKRLDDSWRSTTYAALDLYDRVGTTDEIRLQFRRQWVKEDRRAVPLLTNLLRAAQTRQLQHPEILDEMVAALEEITHLGLKKYRKDVPRLVAEVDAWEKEHPRGGPAQQAQRTGSREARQEAQRNP